MPEIRTAIYAHHSTDKQNPTSSADYAAACEALMERIARGGTYTDPEVSGYRRDRPGLMRLLRDVRDGRVDVVVCEALDRIARDGEDISWIGKKLRFDRVRLVTVTEGEIDEVKLAVAGLLGSMFLSNLQRKTPLGMKAAVLAGRLAGGKASGYARVAASTIAARWSAVSSRSCRPRRRWSGACCGSSPPAGPRSRSPPGFTRRAFPVPAAASGTPRQSATPIAASAATDFATPRSVSRWKSPTCGSLTMPSRPPWTPRSLGVRAPAAGGSEPPIAAGTCFPA